MERATLTRFDAEPFRILILWDMCLSTRLNQVTSLWNSVVVAAVCFKRGTRETCDSVYEKIEEYAMYFHRPGKMVTTLFSAYRYLRFHGPKKFVSYRFPRPYSEGAGLRIEDENPDTRSKQNRRTRPLPLSPSQNCQTPQ